MSLKCCSKWFRKNYWKKVKSCFVNTCHSSFFIVTPCRLVSSVIYEVCEIWSPIVLLIKNTAEIVPHLSCNLHPSKMICPHLLRSLTHSRVFSFCDYNMEVYWFLSQMQPLSISFPLNTTSHTNFKDTKATKTSRTLWFAVYKKIDLLFTRKF